MDILKKINTLRIQRNWSIYRLSIESGVPQSTITNMFNRETLPSITTLEMICNAFGISLSDFFDSETSDKTRSQQDDLREQFSLLSSEDKVLVMSLIKSLNSKQ